MTRLDALRKLEAIDPRDGYPRVLVWCWKQADKLKVSADARTEQGQ